MNALVVIGTAAVSVLVGLLVLFRAAQRRIGWLLVAHGLCFGVVLTNDGTSTSPAGMVGDQLAAGAWVFLFLWLVLIAYLLPDGHTLSAGLAPMDAHWTGRGRRVPRRGRRRR